MTVNELKTILKSEIIAQPEIGEFTSIFNRISEYLDLPHTDNSILSEQTTNAFEMILAQIATNKPLQYILGYEYFGNNKILVNENTLIPRIETEELCYIISKENSETNLTITDFCTGSGCIPIYLCNKNSTWKSVAIDISKPALDVAYKNICIHNLQSRIQLVELDILTESYNDQSSIWISNPPYVTDGEKLHTATNVLNFEPHIALFVPDENPFVFYEKIGELFVKNKTSQKLYVEINSNLFEQTIQKMRKFGNCELLQDMHGNPRYIRVLKISSAI